MKELIKKDINKKQMAFRLLIYAAGLIILACGVIEPDASTSTNMKRSASSDRSFLIAQHFLSARNGSLY